MENDGKNIAMAIKSLQAEKEKLYNAIQKIDQLVEALNGFVNGFVFPINETLFKNHIHSISPVIQINSRSVTEAAREYLVTTNKPASAIEIHQGLLDAGYEFPEKWGEKYTLKNLAITLSKNKDYFTLLDGGKYFLAPVPSQSKKIFIQSFSHIDSNEEINVYETAL